MLKIIDVGLRANQKTTERFDMEGEEKQILRTIREDPADDLPRLVFADWLEEREDSVECCRCLKGCTYPADDRLKPSAEFRSEMCDHCDGTGFRSNGFALRAEYIRTECERARVPPMPPECRMRLLVTSSMPATQLDEYATPCGSNCECCRWQAQYSTRVRAIAASTQRTAGRGREGPDRIPTNLYEWFSVGMPPGVRFILRRGFVSTVFLSPLDFEKYGKFLFDVHPVERVDMEHSLNARDCSGTRTTIHRHDLPAVVWDVMCLGSYREDAFVKYTSIRGAVDAMSTAYVVYGRSLARLPPLHAVSITAGESS